MKQGAFSSQLIVVFFSSKFGFLQIVLGFW